MSDAVPVENDLNEKNNSFKTAVNIYPLKEEDKRLNYWVLIAIIISFIIHFLLIVILKHLELNIWGERTEIKARHVNLREVIYDPNADNYPKNSVENSKDNEASTLDIKNIQEQLDIYELQKQIPDVDIKLTPSEKNVKNFMIIDESELSIENSTKTISDLKNFKENISDVIKDNNKQEQVATLMEQSVGENVPSIEIGQQSDKGLDSSEFIKGLKLSKSQLNQNVKIMKGYSDIDSLLSNDGKFPDASKPILMPADLLFAYNSYELKEESRYSLMKLGVIIQKNPYSRFVFEGHADTFGDHDYNRDLSIKRAEAVKNWLKNSLLIDDSRIRVVGYGKTRPLIIHGSKEEQAINRRVEISIKN